MKDFVLGNNNEILSSLPLADGCGKRTRYGSGTVLLTRKYHSNGGSEWAKAAVDMILMRPSLVK
jgi:hypothetical protein